MPGLTLPAFPRAPRHSYVVTLGGEQYRVRLTWRWRLAAWYLDLWTSSGVPVVLGRRVAAGSLVVPDTNASGEVGGLIFVAGLDGYGRGDLGDALELVYFDRAELPDTTTPPDYAVEVAP